MINGKAICVYCSSSDAVAPVYFSAARELGCALAEHGHILIYGGGNRGLMGEVARAMHESSGQIVGVLPEALLAQQYKQADETVVTKDMRERKAVMEGRADAFIALPGGFGTLEEVLEILTLKQLRYHNKAIVLANIEGYYTHLAEMFEHLYTHHFSKPDYRVLYHITPSIDDALMYIETYAPPNLPDKWFDPHSSPVSQKPE